MNPPAVQYSTTPDGFNIAFGESGAGRPLVFLPLTFSHVQLFWNDETVLCDGYKGSPNASVSSSTTAVGRACPAEGCQRNTTGRMRCLTSRPW